MITRVIIAAGLALSSAAQSAGKTMPDVPGAPTRNVVLVHGAFADGSGWRGVYDDLTARGYRVTIVQNPLTSLADDVAATRRALDRQDGPAVLVGHSWGGTVITEAGVHPKVSALVYVSALSPDAGETTAQQYDGYTTPPEFVIDTHADGFGFIKAESFRAGFAADATPADAAFLRDSQVPINMAVFGTVLKNAAWRSKPSWVAASHAVFMTQPKAVADVIDDAARQVSAAAH